MCSIQDGDEPLKKAVKSSRLGRKCMKCKEQDAILITRVNDAFCRDCFQVYVTHKFRATIGKTKLVRDGEQVLVAYSGGQCSSALLHLIQEGLSHRAHKKLRFKPGVVFIDEGASVDLGVSERLSNCERVHTILHTSGFPCYIKSLEEGYDLDKLSADTGSFKDANPTFTLDEHGHVLNPFVDCDTDSFSRAGTESVTLPDMSPCVSPAFRDGGSSSEDSVRVEGAESRFQIYDDAERQLKQTLQGLKSVSAKEDFICSLRRKILLDVARNHGYTKVMLGTTGTRLSVCLLTDISTGRGAHAAMETAFADKRNNDVMFLRPLREFSSKEVAMYNNLHKVESLVIPSLTTKGDVGASIEHLTEAFVTGLQADYPSTVSNIMRTGEKLDSQRQEKLDKYCAMCQGPLDTSVGASSALSAVEFSQKLSRGKKSCTKGDNPSTGGECCGEGDGSCQTTAQSRPTAEEVLDQLCYGCRLVVKEMDDVYRLPDYVLKDVAWRSRRAKMMTDIKDFLIEET